MSLRDEAHSEITNRDENGKAIPRYWTRPPQVIIDYIAELEERQALLEKALRRYENEAPTWLKHIAHAALKEVGGVRGGEEQRA